MNTHISYLLVPFSKLSFCGLDNLIVKKVKRKHPLITLLDRSASLGVTLEVDVLMMMCAVHCNIKQAACNHQDHCDGTSAFVAFGITPG